LEIIFCSPNFILKIQQTLSLNSIIFSKINNFSPNTIIFALISNTFHLKASVLLNTKILSLNQQFNKKLLLLFREDKFKIDQEDKGLIFLNLIIFFATFNYFHHKASVLPNFKIPFLNPRFKLFTEDEFKMNQEDRSLNIGNTTIFIVISNYFHLKAFIFLNSEILFLDSQLNKDQLLFKENRFKTNREDKSLITMNEIIIFVPTSYNFQPKAFIFSLLKNKKIEAFNLSI